MNAKNILTPTTNTDALDQALLTVDDATFTKLQELIQNPSEPSDKLVKLLKTQVPWG